MLTCAEFDDRLYDEDCRRAAVAGALVPADVREHLAQCETCRAAFEAAAGDCLEMPGLLRLEPPPSLDATLARLAERAAPRAGRGLFEWRQTGSRAVTAGAVSAALVAGLGGVLASPQWQLAVFVLAGSIAAGLQASCTRWSDLGWR